MRLVCRIPLFCHCVLRVPATRCLGRADGGVLTKSQYESLFTLTTQAGERLSGPNALKGMGDWMLPQKPMSLRNKRLGCGVFKMHVQPDGTVARVDVVRSVGDAAFDQQIAAMFKKVK